MCARSFESLQVRQVRVHDFLVFLDLDLGKILKLKKALVQMKENEEVMN